MRAGGAERARGDGGAGGGGQGRAVLPASALPRTAYGGLGLDLFLSSLHIKAVVTD